MVTLTTLRLTPMRQGSMGTREGMSVYVCEGETGRGGRERERWEECRFVAAVSFQTKTYTNSKRSPDYLPSAGSSGTVLPL